MGNLQIYLYLLAGLVDKSKFYGSHSGNNIFRMTHSVYAPPRWFTCIFMVAQFPSCTCQTDTYELYSFIIFTSINVDIFKLCHQNLQCRRCVQNFVTYAVLSSHLLSINGVFWSSNLICSYKFRKLLELSEYAEYVLSFLSWLRSKNDTPIEIYLGIKATVSKIQINLNISCRVIFLYILCTLTVLSEVSIIRIKSFVKDLVFFMFRIVEL